MSLSDRKDTQQRSELHEAALFGKHEDALKLKQSHPEYLNMLQMRDEDSDCLPLDRAAARGHFAMVEFLVNEHKKNKIKYSTNKENYSPLLSVVRWYCKVLDGTYADNVLVGQFNTGETSDTGYLNIIRLLMQEFPEHIHMPDNKGLYAMHYVFFHLKNAIKSGDQDNKEKLTNLVKILIENGMSLDRSYKSLSPRGMANNDENKTISSAVIDIFNKVENKVKPVKQSMASLQKAVSTNDIKTTAHRNNSKKRNTAKDEALIDLQSFEIDFVPALNSNNIAVAVAPKETDKIIPVTPKLPKKVPNKNIASEQKLSTAQQLTTPNNRKQHTKKNPVILSENESTLTKNECQQLAVDIFNTFKTTTNYRTNSDKEDLQQKMLIEQIAKILLDNSCEQLTKKCHQNRGNVVSDLSKTLRLESITTGFLCCRNTKRWLEFDEAAFNKMIKGDHLKQKTL